MLYQLLRDDFKIEYRAGACIVINDILISHMDKKATIIDIPVKRGTSASFILSGELENHSTEELHYHSCHQILRIDSGISLLVEENKKQPLFSNMTAFIPAGLTHRSVVLSESVTYKSIYIDDSLFDLGVQEIVIFDMSKLAMALFDRIESLYLPDDDTTGFDSQCLDLLLKLMETEIDNASHFAGIPVPQKSENLKITSFIEKNYQEKINLSDFTKVMFYSKRHISRLFKDDMGISIFDYLKLYRIFQASLILRCKGENLSITEIAYECGYNSLSSFYSDFKDIFAMTPREFRSKNR